MNLNDFYIAGVNYKKSDANIRGLFSVSEEAYEKLLDNAKNSANQSVFVLSTCNRTEIYGVGKDVRFFIRLLCSVTQGNENEFEKIGYTLRGKEAILHTFSVTAGLDSQILGDYEIMGQMKQAFAFAKNRKMTGPFLDRLFNTAAQASKSVKNQTAISSGTVSVSFATILYLKKKFNPGSDPRILVIGTGKIGKSISQNLVDYMHTHNVTLLNRTFDKSQQIAQKLHVRCDTMDNLKEQCKMADAIIVATSSPNPIIKKEHLEESTKLLIDLSVPSNIEPTCGTIKGIKLVNVDDISEIKDETIRNRKKEVPHALKIIEEHYKDFMQWFCLRKQAPVLRELKQKLKTLYSSDLFEEKPTNDDNLQWQIQKTIDHMAVKMRTDHFPGCNYIEAINHFLDTSRN